jgi:outer membrane protein
MKNLLFLVLFALVVPFAVQAQKFAYVDTEAILKSMPEYAKAQKELDAASEKWQAELDAQYELIEKMRQKLKAEQILMSDEAKRKKEQEIEEKLKRAETFHKQKFGLEGELFKLRKKLIKPIQDKIYEELEDIAKRENLAIIFDASSSSNILYTNDRYDKTDLVIKKLGYERDDD